MNILCNYYFVFFLQVLTSEYTKVLVFTFNVGNISTFDIQKFLKKYDKRCNIDYQRFDIILFNLQEFRQLNYNLDGWKAKKSQMGQLATIVYSKNNVEFQYECIGHGVLGFINKGFVISKIGNLVNVNMHLPAHSWKEKERIKSLSYLRTILRPFNITTHRIILSGDMNFRIINDEDEGKYTRSVLNKDVTSFFYNEYNVCFPKTYKYIRGTSNYISNPSKRCWTDRIWYVSNDNITSLSLSNIDKLESNVNLFNRVKPCISDIFIYTYNSIVFEEISDHKPVYAKIIIKDINLQESSPITLNIGSYKLKLTKIYIFIWTYSILLVVTSLFIILCTLCTFIIKKYPLKFKKWLHNNLELHYYKKLFYK